jgi:hypothetical protein
VSAIFGEQFEKRQTRYGEFIPSLAQDFAGVVLVIGDVVMISMVMIMGVTVLVVIGHRWFDYHYR